MKHQIRPFRLLWNCSLVLLGFMLSETGGASAQTEGPTWDDHRIEVAPKATPSLTEAPQEGASIVNPFIDSAPALSPSPKHQRAARRDPATPTTSDQREPPGYSVNGFALEALTSGFASGGLGSLLLGYKWRQVVFGGNLGFSKNTLASTGTDGQEDLVAFRFGPAARLVVAHSQDERTELFLHGDIGLVVVNGSLPASTTRSSSSATDAAFQLNAGAGVRYWICRNLAVGYVAILKFSGNINQPSNGIALEMPAIMGAAGWILDGSFVVLAAF